MNTKRARLLILNVLLTLCFSLFAEHRINLEVLAQTPAVETRCGTAVMDGSALPNPFPGALFLLDFAARSNQIILLRRITQQGVTEFTAPLTQQQVSNLSKPRISPDGRLMSFTPVNIETPLTVWDLETNEIATLALTAEEVEYLTAEFESAHCYSSTCSGDKHTSRNPAYGTDS